jgi:hypothetical protein
VDRTGDIQEWVKVCHTILHRGIKILAFANNYYGGHGPATIAHLLELWRKNGPADPESPQLPKRN